MALFTTLLIALSPLIQQDPAPRPPEPVVSSPTPGVDASRSVGALPVPSAVPPESQALASWYPQRPSACWDARGRHALPPGLIAYTASRTLPCGALVVVSGPAGSITVPVEDYGPEARTGRAFDLSPAAFQQVAGTLATGVVAVAWRPAA